MKKQLLFILIFSAVASNAQNVTINPTGITPAPLAVDIPKLTFDQIQALPSPQLGDIVTDITFKCLRFHNGEKWLRIMTNYEIPYKDSRAFGFGSNANDNGLKLAIDNNNNLILVGYFESNISFGAFNLTYTGIDTEPDFFVAKIKPDGTVLFAKKIDNSGFGSLTDLKVDNSNNIYLSGHSSNSQFEIYSLGESWILKLNSSGSYVWSKSTLISGLGFEGLAIDNSGKVYVAGFLSGNITFEGYSFVSNGGDLLIITYDINGNLLWFKQSSGSGMCIAYDIGLDSQNNILVYCYFSGSESFGSYSTPYVSGFLIAKYTPISSTWNWLLELPFVGGSKFLIKNDQLYVGGSFSNTITFSGKSISPNASSTDIFLVKYNYQLNNSTPSVAWAKAFGGTDYDTFGGLDVDANGNIYLAGTFYGNDFEIDGNAARNNYDNKEVFIAKLNAQGKGIWIKTPDGRHELGDNGFNDLKVDNAGNAYGFGRYNFDVKIGPNNLSATNGSYDILLMQVVD